MTGEKEYKLRREELLNNTPSKLYTIRDERDPYDERKHIGVIIPGSHQASRTTEDIAERLQGMENLLETKRMRAVEHAAELIGLDLPEDQRKKLVNGIFASCIRWRKYPFERMGIEGMERSCFYDRRRKFLLEIAKYMEM